MLHLESGGTFKRMVEGSLWDCRWHSDAEEALGQAHAKSILRHLQSKQQLQYKQLKHLEVPMYTATNTIITMRKTHVRSCRSTIAICCQRTTHLDVYRPMNAFLLRCTRNRIVTWLQTALRFHVARCRWTRKPSVSSMCTTKQEFQLSEFWKLFSFWGASPPDSPLGLRPWTPLGDSVPQTLCTASSFFTSWLRPCNGQQ